jgi:UDP-N-acetylglucosamine 2-epimerase
LKPKIISTNRADYAMAEPLRAAGLEDLDLSVPVTVVLGDRVEMLHAATDAVQRGDKLVHIGGGETMRASRQFPDHMFRNAISQLSDLHCVANTTAVLNLGDIGIGFGSVINTGLPSLDRLVAYMEHNRNVVRPKRLEAVFVAFHPYPQLPLEYTMREALAMLDGVAATGWKVLVSRPNMDKHGLYLFDLYQQYCKRAGWELMPQGYNEHEMLRIYETFACAVGNSSALRIEASALGLPVVEIGNRQSGRVLPASVMPLLTPTAPAVRDTILRWSDKAFEPGSPWANVYGRAAQEIVAVVAKRFA